MSTIDGPTIRALGRRLTDIATEVSAYSRSLATLLPGDQWHSPAATLFQRQLQPAATALAGVADRLAEAAGVLLAHLQQAQQREQEVAAAAARTLHAAEHAAASVATDIAGPLLAPFGVGSGRQR